MSKPLRDQSLVKPVMKVAVEVAEEYIDGVHYETIDVLTRLRAAINFGNEAGLSVCKLEELESRIYGQA